MLYSISSIITKYFFKKNIITNSDQEVFTYGCQLIISSFCSISSILLLSFFINITYGILFLLFFFPIRLFCGGFHASSYIKCFLCTNTIFIRKRKQKNLRRKKSIYMGIVERINTAATMIVSSHLHRY